MRRGGRRPASTREQRQLVLELAANGISRRRIAAEVFGDSRYHGRVDRIIRRLPSRELPVDLDSLSDREHVPVDATTAESDLPSIADILRGFEQLSVAEILRGLVERHWRRIEEEGVLPSPAELSALLRLERELDNRAELERLNEITRESSD